MKERAAIYCRLSKEDADKDEPGQESRSIINQTMMLLDYVKQQDFQLCGIYKDDDYSGLYDNRPGFEKLIEDAKEGKFDVIVAKTQARFTRNMEHLERYLHHDFPIWGIRFIGVVDNSDTADRGNKKARQINGLVNEWYCEDLSENIRASFKIKQKEGQFLGASAPYGYIKDPEDHHRLVPDPFAASVVRRIFEMYICGTGKSKIAEILTDEGILIPSLYKRQVLGQNYRNPNETKNTGKWTFQTVSGILKNEVYIGNMVQNKSARISYKDKKKVAQPKSRWIRKEGTHRPIVDKEVFLRAQSLIEERASPVKRPLCGVGGVCGRKRRDIRGEDECQGSRAWDERHTFR